MDFGKAYSELLNGKKIKREIWEKNTYIALHQADVESVENYIYLSVNSVLRAWTSAQTDIPSNDWAIYEE